MHQLHLILRRLADAGLEFVVVGGYAEQAVGREKDLLAVKELQAIAAKRAQNSRLG